MKNIEWDKLEKTRIERVVSTTFIEKILPEGVYACPQCDGEGNVMTVHRFSPPHKYGTCGMCKGTGEIRKCPKCYINPVPNFVAQQECIDCHEIYMKKVREKFMERCTKCGVELHEI